MSLCLHCDEPCAEHAVFCEECQEQARELFQQEQPEQLAFVAEFSPQTPTSFASSPGEEEEVLLGAVTVPFEPSEPVAEALPVEHGLSSSDQVLSRLSAAARLISTEEAGEPRLKRSSRLRPLRDISEDIQRASTPHPSQKRHTDF